MLLRVGPLAALACTAALLATAGQLQSQSLEGTVRIVASRQEDGRVEIALQQQQPDGSWNEPQLPEKRFLPSTAPTGRWLQSSAVTVGVAGSEVAVRIVANRHEDGRVEIALQQQQPDGSWNEPQLPEKRFLPSTAPTGRWLQSSPVRLGPARVPDQGRQTSEAPNPPPPDPASTSQTGSGSNPSPPDPPSPDPPPPPDPSPPPTPQDAPPQDPPPQDPSPPPPPQDPPPQDPPPPTTTTTAPAPPQEPPEEECQTTDGVRVCFRPLTPEEWEEHWPRG
ncbi:MAG: hypothetical protein OXG91_02970 [bacterium]|nr:hypothetical protein [bacterium]